MSCEFSRSLVGSQIDDVIDDADQHARGRHHVIGSLNIRYIHRCHLLHLDGIEKRKSRLEYDLREVMVPSSVWEHDRVAAPCPAYPT